MDILGISTITVLSISTFLMFFLEPLGCAIGGASVEAGGLEPPYPKNSMKIRGRKEGAEDKKKDKKQKEGLQEGEGR